MNKFYEYLPTTFKGQVFYRPKNWRILGITLVVFMIITAVITGFKGFSEYSETYGLGWEKEDILYRTLQLFALESGFVRYPHSWELEVARFVAATAMLAAAFIALSVILGEMWIIIRLTVKKNHIVICGLGRKGMQLVQDYRAKGPNKEKVVMIEGDAANGNIMECGKYGSTVILGDATNKYILERARVQRAQKVIAVCGDDDTNLNIAACTYAIIQQKKKKHEKPIECYVQIADLALSRLLNKYPLHSVGGTYVENRQLFKIMLFNPYLSAARQLLQSSAFLDLCSISSSEKDRTVHLVVVGFGQMGESVVLHAARIGHFANGQKIKIIVIDLEAPRKEIRFNKKYRHFQDILKIEFIQGDIMDEEIQDRFIKLAHRKNNLAVVICIDGDSQSLTCALKIKDKVHNPKVPIFIRTSEERDFHLLLEKEIKGLKMQRQLHAFRMVCSRELLTKSDLDKAAKKSYEFYQQTNKNKCISNDIYTNWEGLNENVKDFFRQGIDHIYIKLKAIGWEVEQSGMKSDDFNSEEVETMARMEHARWYDEKKLFGWNYGPANCEMKTDPYLVSWDKLPEQVRQCDRDFVRSINKQLEETGKRAYRSNAD